MTVNHRLAGIAVLALVAGVGGHSAFAQDKPSDQLVTLPGLSAYRLPKGDYLLLNVRCGEATADFIRKLRKVPLIRPQGVPTSLIFDKYLHQNSTAIETEACYLETDWLPAEDIASIASVAQHTASSVSGLVRTDNIEPVKLVIAKTEETYLALVDAWADTDRAKKQARSLSSLLIGSYRCGSKTSAQDVMTLAASTAVAENLEVYLWNQKAIREGLHTFVTSFITLDYEQYVSTKSTIPTQRKVSNVVLLFETARDILSRAKHESLETVLRSDLNSLTFERLSVAVAFVHYILETQRDHWGDFLKVLAQESSENGKLKGPEGLWKALSKSISQAFGLEMPELEKALQEFAAKHYLHSDEIAVLMGIDHECAESSFQGFLKICELKRQKKPVTEKGEKLYQEILGRIDKKLLAAGEKF